MPRGKKAEWREGGQERKNSSDEPFCNQFIDLSLVVSIFTSALIYLMYMTNPNGSIYSLSMFEDRSEISIITLMGFLGFSSACNSEILIRSFVRTPS